MVVLLVGMAVAAIWMSALLPAWRQQVQRQREEDLIFIGEQYARAIVLYQMKNQAAFPPSIEALVSGHYLRKAWKDPITGEDFAVIGPPMGPGTAPGTPGRQTGPGIPSQGPGRSTAPSAQQVTPSFAGVSGVRSRSKATSIKIYRNLQQHDLWPFDAAQMYPVLGNPSRQGGPGRGGPGGPVGPGGPGGPGGQRGGDGRAVGPGGRGGPTGPGGAQLPPGGRGRGN